MSNSFIKKRIFEEGRPYHILSRAVEGIEIFGRKEDCSRFIFRMYAANIGRPGFHLTREGIEKAAKAILLGEEIPPKMIIMEHPPLVHVLSFALVLNHYHLKLVQNLENGISKYMQKLNGGFAKFFNLKYGRHDTLFGSRYQSIPIETDFQRSAVKRYINVINPLDVCEPGWREKGLKNWKEAFECITSYQFSSLPDLLGLRNSKILAPKEVLERYYGEQLSEDKAEYAEFVENYLKQNLIDFYPVFLEESLE